jgi:hypothetical protein
LTFSPLEFSIESFELHFFSEGMFQSAVVIEVLEKVLRPTMPCPTL